MPCMDGVNYIDSDCMGLNMTMRLKKPNIELELGKIDRKMIKFHIRSVFQVVDVVHAVQDRNPGYLVPYIGRKPPQTQIVT